MNFCPSIPTACYAQRFGPRGIGHAGGNFLGLMCDALDLEWQRYLLCCNVAPLSIA